MSSKPRKITKNEADQPPKYLTYPQAAEYVQLSERTLSTMVKQNELPHIRVGRSVRFCRRTLDAWLKSNMRGGGGAFNGANDSLDMAESDSSDREVE